MPSIALDAARGGDQAAFQSLVAPHRRGLLAHCYRMTGSLQEAEELTQDALLRAWKGLARFEGRSSFRTWLYRIATHASLDALKSSSRRLLPQATHAPAKPGAPLAPPEPTWLEPFPDHLLPDDAPGADTLLSQRQSVGLAFLQTLQQLPATQRAAVLLKDAIGLTAVEVADVLDTTVPATNSLLQRARRTLQGAPPPQPVVDPQQAQLVARYVAAWESANVDDLVTLLRDDVKMAMPPTPSWFLGATDVAGFLRFILDGTRQFRAVPTAANGLPAVALFEKVADGYTLGGVHVLDAEERIGLIVAFMDPAVLERFELAEPV